MTNYGTVNFEGRTYTLLDEAEANNYGTNGAVRYYANATDENGDKFMVAWETTEKWDKMLDVYNRWQQLVDNEDLTEEEATELAKIEEENNGEPSLPNDESDACDWDDPVEVVAC